LNTVTLGQLRESVKRKADMEDSDFISDQEFNELINSALSRTHDLLVNTYEDYFLQKALLHIEAGREEYILPDDLLKLKGVFYLGSGNSKYMLKTWELDDLQFDDMVAATTVLFDSGVENLRYRMFGNKIVFFPVPTKSGDCEIWYVPQFKKLEEDNDSVEWVLPIGWEDYTKYLAVSMALAIEESDNRFWTFMAQEEERRIRENAPDRDTGRPIKWKEVVHYREI